ncbi:MAG: hypothetical protein IPG96_06930 [Proteobacteria bacterium]|nr:hypothetical protein [Pseudomonadota bacterium]
MYDGAAQGGNSDGRIDARDAAFARLRIWVDRDHDGHSQPNEFGDLSQHGITSFALQPRRLNQRVPGGRISLTLGVEGPGGPRTAYDVWFDNVASPGFPKPLD